MMMSNGPPQSLLNSFFIRQLVRQLKTCDIDKVGRVKKENEKEERKHYNKEQFPASVQF